MRILISIGGFLPATNYGGPVVSIYNLCKILKEKFEIYIVTVDHDINSTQRFEGIEEGWNDYGYAKVLYLRDSETTFRNIKKIVKGVEPDLLYTNSLFMAKFTIPFQLISKLESIPLLIAPRGELCIQPYSTKRIKKLPYTFLLRNIIRNKNAYYQSTSEEEYSQIIKTLRADKSKILSLENIPSIPNINEKNSDKIAGVLKGVFLSRIHPKKNLDFALEVLSNVKENVFFDIYGNIEDTLYWEKCQRIIKKLPPNIVVNYKGTVNHTDVFKVFTRYDVFFFPTKSENYGHVIVEAMLSNCLVLLSDQTPWNDIKESGGGWAVNLSEEEKFIEIIEKIALMGQLEYSNKVEKAKKYIDYKLDLESLKIQYNETFEQIIKAGAINL